MELITALVQDISARQVVNKLNIMELIAALVQDISARQVDNKLNIMELKALVQDISARQLDNIKAYHLFELSAIVKDVLISKQSRLCRMRLYDPFLVHTGKH